MTVFQKTNLFLVYNLAFIFGRARTGLIGHYNKVQQQYGFFSLSGVKFISRTISANTSLTLVRCLALASMKGHPHCWARRWPSGCDTCDTKVLQIIFLENTKVYCLQISIFNKKNHSPNRQPIFRIFSLKKYL